MAEAPLWQVEDALTAARQAAQNEDTPKNRQEVKEKINHALTLLEA